MKPRCNKRRNLFAISLIAAACIASASPLVFAATASNSKIIGYMGVPVKQQITKSDIVTPVKGFVVITTPFNKATKRNKKCNAVAAFVYKTYHPVKPGTLDVGTVRMIGPNFATNGWHPKTGVLEDGGEVVSGNCKYEAVLVGPFKTNSNKSKAVSENTTPSTISSH